MTREEFRATVIEYALAGVQGADESTLLDQGIEVDTINGNVLKEFSQGISEKTGSAYYLQKKVPITITDGSSGALPSDIFGESLDWGLVLDENGKPSSEVRNLGDMYRPLSTEFSYFCLSDGQLYYRAAGNSTFAPGSGTGDNASINLTVNFQPTLDTLTLIPDTIADDLVRLAVKRVREASRGLFPDETGRWQG